MDGKSVVKVSADTCFIIDDIKNDADGSWQKGEKNPDHLLVEIHAANKDFQSKLHKAVGSYMIYGFVKSQLGDLESAKHDRKYIHEHFDAIERDLESKGKQKSPKNLLI